MGAEPTDKPVIPFGLKLAILFAAVAAVLLGVPQAYVSCGPAGAFPEAKLTTLPSGRAVLVAREGAGGRQGGYNYTLRFEVFDAKTGERLQRLSRSLFASNRYGVRYLGGAGARQWWGAGDRAQLIDVATGEWIADEKDLAAKNPALRGELHSFSDSPSGSPGYFAVEPATGALVARGGGGEAFAIDPVTLEARLHRGPVPKLREDRFVPPTDRTGPTPLDAVQWVLPGDGELVTSCATIGHQELCSLKWITETKATRWTLSTDDLQGNSFAGVRELDAETLYLYISDRGLLARYLGGVYLYAVDRQSGKIRWREKI